jgi:hypothetical protein
MRCARLVSYDVYRYLCRMVNACLADDVMWTCALGATRASNRFTRRCRTIDPTDLSRLKRVGEDLPQRLISLEHTYILQNLFVLPMSCKVFPFWEMVQSVLS